RVTFGHVGALDDDAVGVLQVLLHRGGAAAAEAGPQTGDGGGVSNTRLVLDLDGAERGEQLLEQVVLFVVQRRAAEAGEAERPPGPLVVDLPLPPLAPGLDDPVRDHVHRRVEVKIYPIFGITTSVLHPVLAGGSGGELEGGGTLGAQ